MSSAPADANPEEVAFYAAEGRATKVAMRKLQELHPFTGYPHTDEIGVTRHGFGRNVHRQPMTEATGLQWLADDLEEIKRTLRSRVFELIAIRPAAEEALGVIYAVADLLGATTIRDHHPLWSALLAGNGRQVVIELMACNWDRYYGTTPEKQRAVVELMWGLASPEGAR